MRLQPVRNRPVLAWRCAVAPRKLLSWASVSSSTPSGALSCPSSSDTPSPWTPPGGRLEGRQSPLADQPCSLLPERVLPQRGRGWTRQQPALVRGLELLQPEGVLPPRRGEGPPDGRSVPTQAELLREGRCAESAGWRLRGGSLAAGACQMRGSQEGLPGARRVTDDAAAAATAAGTVP